MTKIYDVIAKRHEGSSQPDENAKEKEGVQWDGILDSSTN